MPGLFSIFSQENQFHRACKKEEAALVEERIYVSAQLVQESFSKGQDSANRIKSVGQIKHLSNLADLALSELGIIREEDRADYGGGVLKESERDTDRDRSIINSIKENKIVQTAGGVAFFLRYLKSGKMEPQLLDSARELAGEEFISKLLSAIKDETASEVKDVPSLVRSRIREAKKKLRGKIG